MVSYCYQLLNLIDEVTLADFFIFIIVYSLVDKELVTLDNFPKLKAWFEHCNEVPALATVRGRARRFLKFVYFYTGWVMPVIRCFTCKRRRNRAEE